MSAASKLTVPDVIADVAYSYGTALLDHGDLEKASAVIGQVGRWSEHDFRCAVLQVRLYQALGQEEAWRTALDRAKAIAGERPLPPALLAPPERTPLAMRK
jgi:hypothetical protein